MAAVFIVLLKTYTPFRLERDLRNLLNLREFLRAKIYLISFQFK